MREISNEILSDITVFQKYAKYLPEKQTRETWSDIIDRYKTMMIEKYPNLEDPINEASKLIYNKKILPSMRALQFAGKPIERNNSRIYNCAFLPVDDYRAFSETMFLLLGGTGVGYSVQKHHVEKLPNIKKPLKNKKYLINDSLEGWADAIKVLMKSYLGYSEYKPKFDFTDIRPKGSPLKTAGGKAPGPEPLKLCIAHIEAVLERKQDGEKLKTIEAHDIMCHIANAVLAGGIRRSAMISLFSKEDDEMITCKSGSWWELNPQRGRANNSVILERNNTSKEEFDALWKRIEASNAGEPGIYWTDNKELGTNPCCEISLKAFQFCNLSELNVSDVIDQNDLNQRASIGAFFGTLQAGFTDFHYLRPIWKKTTEEEALIGVGMTGIASGAVLNLDLKQAAQVVKETNEIIAGLIGINCAARTTTIKPSGTSSCVLGTSSGIHAWHNDYYIRRQRILKNEALYTYLSIYHPELLEDDQFEQHQAIVVIPQKAPKGSILRTESALDLVERVKKFNLEWVKEGHRSGDNTNNVSATISINKNKIYLSGFDPHLEADEWFVIGEWMWDNKHTYNGLSVLNYDGGSYVQAPFEDCSKEKYEELYKTLKNIDLSKVVEIEDLTNHTQEVACAGGQCSI